MRSSVSNALAMMEPQLKARVVRITRTLGSVAQALHAGSQQTSSAAGQVAIRLGSNYRTQPATAIWLFNSPMLQ